LPVPFYDVLFPSFHLRHPPPRRWRAILRRMLCVSLLATGAASGTNAEPIDLSFGAASATVQRGVTLGEGGIDVHIAVSWAGASGWRAALGATVLHARAAPAHWNSQLFGRLGYAHRLDEDWSAQAAFTRYAYRGSAALRRYAHDELGATLAYRDLLYLSVSGLRTTGGSNRAEGRHSAAYDLVARHALPAELTASAGIGRHTTRGTGFGYTYGHLGLGRPWGVAQAQLSYVATDAKAKERFGSAAADRWTLGLGWEF
jgi:hypothetical protein